MASGDEDGGPAFPVVHAALPLGMTLRDYFAGHALAGLATIVERDGYETLGHVRAEWQDMATAAYGFADAMLEARK